MSDVDDEAVRKLDAVDQIDDLLRIGQAAAREVDLAKQFGALVTEGALRRAGMRAFVVRPFGRERWDRLRPRPSRADQARRWTR